MAAKLRVVSAPSERGSPPRKLGEHGLALWTRINDEYSIVDGGGVEMLCQACQALDRAEDCAALIERDGAVIRHKGSYRENPLLKVELAARALCIRTLQKLGLDVEPVGRVGLSRGY